MMAMWANLLEVFPEGAPELRRVELRYEAGKPPGVLERDAVEVGVEAVIR